jgi:putative component of membrane protein insertase Oxa1/YidC/SpoIIIJ protein YidD
MINSCKGCVPPKRTPTCKFDGTCNNYADAKKKHDAERAAILKAKRVNSDIVNQRADSVSRAIRRKGKPYGETNR